MMVGPSSKTCNVLSAHSSSMLVFGGYLPPTTTTPARKLQVLGGGQVTVQKRLV